MHTEQMGGVAGLHGQAIQLIRRRKPRVAPLAEEIDLAKVAGRLGLEGFDLLLTQLVAAHDAMIRERGRR